MSQILNCIRGGFNRWFNYSLTFHPEFPGVPFLFAIGWNLNWLMLFSPINRDSLKLL